MGIKDLNSFLKENAPASIRNTTLLDSFKTIKNDSGRTEIYVAVDTSIYFYKFLYKNDRFIEGFFQQIARLRRNNITPLYVFDGTPPPEKNDTIKNRLVKKQEYKDKIIELQEKLNNSDDMETEERKTLSIELQKYKKKLIRVTKEHITKLKYFLDLMNIKYIHPNCEADNICSKLCEKGIVDAVLSDDMDLLVSGTRVLLRDFYIGSQKILEYNTSTILTELNLSKAQWVDFCILCGCDYLKRINGLGPKNAFKFIKQYGSIEEILKNQCGEGKKYNVPDNYDFRKARLLFNNCDSYCEEYNNLDIKIDDLFDNQMTNIVSFIKENSMLSLKQINNRLNFVYKVN